MILTADFNLQNARGCLEMCEWVYLNTCDLATPLCHAHLFEVPAVGPLLPGWMAEGQSQIANGTARVLAFRGSASIQDWITDAQFARTAIGAGQEVHHGFLDAVISINSLLLKIAAQDAARPVGEYVPPLFVTGHSLGGAMALLAAKVLLEAGARVEAVYTFGGPRVGNGAWARHYDQRPTSNAELRTSNLGTATLGERTWRVVNEEDIVPRVPGWLMGYRHVGREVFLNSLGGMGVDAPLWSKCLSDALGTWLEWKRGRVAQLVDHAASAYAARLALVQETDRAQQELKGVGA